MKDEQNDPARTGPPRPARMLLGLLLVIAIAACVGLYGRLAKPPGRSSLSPSTAAQPTTHAGYVCRSPHFTLTAEIHAGS